jgi:hypothetical protein
MGLGFSYNYLLEVRGRRTGKLYRARQSTAIEWQALSGCTARTDNAEAAGEISLKRGSYRQRFRLRPVAGDEHALVVKSYLEAFRREVQRYFPVPADAPVEAFVPILGSYPAYELIAA